MSFTVTNLLSPFPKIVSNILYVETHFLCSCGSGASFLSHSDATDAARLPNNRHLLEARSPRCHPCSLVAFAPSRFSCWEGASRVFVNETRGNFAARLVSKHEDSRCEHLIAVACFSRRSNGVRRSPSLQGGIFVRSWLGGGSGVALQRFSRGGWPSKVYI